MTNEEIDKWVEEHIIVPPKEELSEHTKVVYPLLVPAIIEWGKNIAHKFYKLGKSEIPINLTWQDVNKILDISGEMLEEMLEDGDGDFIGMEEAWAKEVLKRFKILKEK